MVKLYLPRVSALGMIYNKKKMGGDYDKIKRLYNDWN